jgi:hypothetical protein
MDTPYTQMEGSEATLADGEKQYNNSSATPPKRGGVVIRIADLPSVQYEDAGG